MSRLICCELRLWPCFLDDDCLYPPSACGVAHGRSVEAVIGDFGNRLGELVDADARIARADGEPDDLGRIAADIEILRVAVSSAVETAVNGDLADGQHCHYGARVDLEGEAWEVVATAYPVAAVVDTGGLTAALAWAAEHGHADAVEALLNAGADVHASSERALRWAAAYGHADVVKLLLAAGAEVYGRGAGDIPLLAEERGHYSVAALLRAAAETR